PSLTRARARIFRATRFYARRLAARRIARERVEAYAAAAREEVDFRVGRAPARLKLPTHDARARGVEPFADRDRAAERLRRQVRARSLPSCRPASSPARRRTTRPERPTLFRCARRRACSRLRPCRPARTRSSRSLTPPARPPSAAPLRTARRPTRRAHTAR